MTPDDEIPAGPLSLEALRQRSPVTLDLEMVSMLHVDLGVVARNLMTVQLRLALHREMPRDPGHSVVWMVARLIELQNQLREIQQTLQEHIMRPEGAGEG